MTMARRLHAISPQAMLAGVLLFGFVITLPFWLASSSEDRQRVTQTTATAQVVEQNVGMLDVEPEEKRQLSEMLQPREAQAAESVDFERQVWLRDIVGLISRWVPDRNEAEAIARWVYTYSVRFDLSPELVLGVIAVESQFDHFAISSVGARGLMQVMPFWKQALGSDEDNLFEIETNVRYGCAILRHYLDRYGSLEKALAAYNGSLGRSLYPRKVYEQIAFFRGKPLDT